MTKTLKALNRLICVDSLRKRILSFWVKNDLLMVSEHLARDHKRFGIALTT